MGNCLRPQNSPSSSSSSPNSRDEWECVVDSTRDRKFKTLRSSLITDDDDDDEVNTGFGFMSIDTEKEKLLASSSSSSSREVKIKITKKELEELVSRLNKQGTTGLSLQQILLARLMINGDNRDDHPYNHLHHHRPWRPALQSIPEVN
ncbi:uncharacterized protein LOC110808080 [Carica papaya]|uniref:uncharacterized protein LOC110808080 n=1 Tax=Carica papaya TaxID=3649 RepID=UPI000B8CD1EC|nr:uncharacterized protein LOC110808080 [Carica papaya]